MNQKNAVVPKLYYPKKEAKPCCYSPGAWILGVCAFLLGSVLTASVILTSQDLNPENGSSSNNGVLTPHSLANNYYYKCPSVVVEERRAAAVAVAGEAGGDEINSSSSSSPSAILQDLKVLVVIVAFDFSQIPHLEEVLSSYHDVCAAGSHVDVIVHATVAYPVTLVDLWNSRFNCPDFTVTIVLKPKSLRLHLVDEHRKVFYDKVHEYDLFVYTEDDIRVTPTTIATYMIETQRIETIVSKGRIGDNNNNKQLKPSDFNVGIVRYEYNYPANVVIDDKTRHATQNVTRVYWEHSGFERPVVNGAVTDIAVAQEHPVLAERYLTMKNHHQGMYLATRELLLEWKDRGPQCDFANARNRPGRGSQPTEGTQRVWMSSQMLYGGRHCNVQQVLPKHSFGTLTVLHLPNKNYRRVGKYRNREFSDGTEVFEPPSNKLLTAMELHLAVRKEWPPEPQVPYRGIRMIDEVNKAGDRSELLERRMREFEAYAKRGGVLSDDDMAKTALVEEA